MTDKKIKSFNLNDLNKEIPYKFKPQSLKFGKALMVSYIDARDVQDLLDEVVGKENWQTEYSVVNENLFARVGIKIPREDGTSEWVWKTDCGVESNTEAEKGEASDAFKRAAVQWGIGRFLYRLKIVELKVAKNDKTGKEYPATDEGKILWNNDQITQYINKYKLNKTNVESVTEPEPAPAPRYQKPTETPTYTTISYSPETIKRVENISRNGLKGKACLKEFLPVFAKKNNLDVKTISELNDDTKLGQLLDYIDSIPPDTI